MRKWSLSATAFWVTIEKALPWHNFCLCIAVVEIYSSSVKLESLSRHIFSPPLTLLWIELNLTPYSVHRFFCFKAAAKAYFRKKILLAFLLKAESRALSGSVRVQGLLAAAFRSHHTKLYYKENIEVSPEMPFDHKPKHMSSQNHALIYGKCWEKARKLQC